MANCAEMKVGDLYTCETCGLELQVAKTCSCAAGEEVSCTVPLQCCGKDMVKNQQRISKLPLPSETVPIKSQIAIIDIFLLL